MAISFATCVLPTCQDTKCDIDELRATGGDFAKIFDVQNKKITTLYCKQCGYTEIYKDSTSTLGNVLDFFVGGWRG